MAQSGSEVAWDGGRECEEQEGTSGGDLPGTLDWHFTGRTILSHDKTSSSLPVIIHRGPVFAVVTQGGRVREGAQGLRRQSHVLSPGSSLS